MHLHRTLIARAARTEHKANTRRRLTEDEAETYHSKKTPSLTNNIEKQWK